MKSNFKISAVLMAIVVFAAAFNVVHVAAPVNALEADNASATTSPAEIPEVTEPSVAVSNEVIDTTDDISESEDTTEPETTAEEEQVVEEEIPVETEPVETEPVETEPEHQEEEHHEEGCNHFWRQEYQPETETEDGYIYESCLYCGEYKLIQTIPAYGNN